MVRTKSELQEKWERSPGYLYFITVGEPPEAVKIGIATELVMRRRLSTLQCGNHKPLTLRGLLIFNHDASDDRPMKRAEKCEKELHQRFAHLRCHRDREWFRATQELIGAIDALHPVSPADHGLPDCVARAIPGMAVASIHK